MFIQKHKTVHRTIKKTYVNETFYWIYCIKSCASICLINYANIQSKLFISTFQERCTETDEAGAIRSRGSGIIWGIVESIC